MDDNKNPNEAEETAQLPDEAAQETPEQENGSDETQAESAEKSGTFEDNYTEPSLKDAVIVMPEDEERAIKNAAAARKIGGADAYRAARAEKFCVKCGKNRKAEGSDYCDECRMDLLTTKSPAAGWLGAFVALTAGLFAVIVLILNAPVALLTVEAKYEESRGCWFNAYYDYVEAMSRADETNTKLNGKIDYVVLGERFNVDMLNAAFNANPTIDTALNLGNVYYSVIGKYSDLSLYKQLIDAYYAILKVEAVQGVLSNVQYGAITYAQAMEALESVEVKNDAERLMLDYLKLSVCDALESDSGSYYASTLEIYKAAEKDLPQYDWFYTSGLMECYFYTGDYDSMIKYCNKVCELNRNDNTAAYCKMIYLMKGNKKDEALKFSEEYTEYNPGVSNVAVAYERRFGSLDKALELCSKITGDQMSAAEDKVECYRQQALAHIAKGEYAKAFDASYLAINESQSLSGVTDNAYSNSLVYETLAVSAYLCYKNSDDSGTYSEYVTTVYDGNNTDMASFPQKIQDILTGKANAEDILTKGAGDLL